MNTPLPQLAYVFKRDDNHIGICILTVLAWVMHSDGDASMEEQLLLDSIAEASGLSPIIPSISNILKTEDLASLELACEILQQELDADGKRRLLELYVGMMLADGYITLSEHHVIRFIADLFDVAPDEMNALFRASTGKEMPRIGDPSSLSWWEIKENGHQQRTHSQSGSDQAAVRRIKALATLGLEEGTSTEEIRQAYRRLALIHHPDRFQSLGPEASKAANTTFVRIKDAYEYLVAV